MARSILVLYAHPRPELSRVNRAMADVARDVPGVRVRDLYADYPDFDIDVGREQDDLAGADLVVWQHPLLWFSCPALLKEWIDRVLTHSATAVQGKAVLLAVSAGGSASVFQPSGVHGHTIEDFLRPIERTVTLCGMTYLPPFVFYGSYRADDAAVQRHAAAYRAHLANLRDADTLPGAR